MSIDTPQNSKSIKALDTKNSKVEVPIALWSKVIDHLQSVEEILIEVSMDENWTVRHVKEFGFGKVDKRPRRYEWSGQDEPPTGRCREIQSSISELLQQVNNIQLEEARKFDEGTSNNAATAPPVK